ncbi:MAG TPA: hypothetical protein PLE16_03365 [Spirochaetota bacterium]|nr:hypothetical protein [Spirochaetota bacterium]
MSKKRFLLIIAVPVLILAVFTSIYAMKPSFGWKYIDILKLSRYNEDRVAFQHVDAFSGPFADDSVECLLVIRDRKMYLFKDGYDDESTVRQERLLLDMENKLYDDQEMWKNKMNGLPDSVIVTDRRIELMKSFDEKFVNDNFGNYYKTVRAAFLKRHVAIFSELMRNRKDSGLLVSRSPIDKEMYLNAPEQPTKYSINASAKTIDEKTYYCEDADGDGITETFTVNRPDGFNWGYRSGPNIIHIYKTKNKEITDIIGNLAKYSYYGTEEEEKNIINTLPKEDEIVDMIKDIVPDEKFYK